MKIVHFNRHDIDTIRKIMKSAVIDELYGWEHEREKELEQEKEKGK